MVDDRAIGATTAGKNIDGRALGIVTGGTRGIGREISLALAREGVRIIALYARNTAAANALETQARLEGLDLVTVKGDLTRAECQQRVVEEVQARGGTVHIVVHSAASGVHREASALTGKHLRWTFEVNVVTIQELLSRLVGSMPRGGRIVGITSAGAARTIPFYAAIGSSKAALEALFRHLAVDLAPRGIAVNMVCPGMVLTEALDAFRDKEERIARCSERTATARLTTAADVAELVRFLCMSKCGEQIVGQVMTIDGGALLPC